MCVDIVKRLKKFMEHIGMPSTQFADYAKIARPTISQLLNGRNRKMSNELLEKLHDAFPDLNMLWLMFGDGEMMIREPQKPEPVQSPNLFSSASPTRQSAQSATISAQPQYGPYNDYQHDAESIPMRSSNIAEFVAENARPIPQQTDPASVAQATAVNINSQTASTADPAKKIQTIMVFYTDSSFEIFTPSQQH